MIEAFVAVFFALVLLALHFLDKAGVERLSRRISRLEDALCADCDEPIVREDDEARVCIACGGRNRRL